MIFCIPVSESKGLDSVFEPDFGKAVSMTICDSGGTIVAEVPVDPSDRGARIPAHFEAVLCGRIERDVWSSYLKQGVRFFGVDATTVRAALDAYRRGNVTAVDIASGIDRPETVLHAGCACGRHGHGRQSQPDAAHACCGGKRHGMGTCGGHGREHGGCGCG